MEVRIAYCYRRDDWGSVLTRKRPDEYAWDEAMARARETSPGQGKDPEQSPKQNKARSGPRRVRRAGMLSPVPGWILTAIAVGDAQETVLED